ncbi:MAG: Rpn family recombination-promoting nuclease/putative transposase [Xenococcaceae cyanobacterium]
MKTDILFAEIFKEFPNIFFEFIGKPEINTNNYSFTSPEIKQRAFRLDGVFAPNAELPNEPIYFVEIQFYKDEEFYDRLFNSIFLYFSQYKPDNPNWYAIVFYARRSQETPVPARYNSLIEPHLRCYYLDEIESRENESLGRGIIRLVVESETQSIELAKQLIEKTRVELTDEIKQFQVLEFIETIVVYKFPLMSREEIENMLDLNLLKETKVYQEAKEEGILEGIQKEKSEIVSKLLQKGFSIQEVADLLELDPEIVRKAAKN